MLALFGADIITDLAFQNRINLIQIMLQQDVFGSVTEGLAADLVLLEANPLDDIGNAQAIIGVMLRGQWFSRTELDEALERIRLRYAR